MTRNQPFGRTALYDVLVFPDVMMLASLKLLVAFASSVNLIRVTNFSISKICESSYTFNKHSDMWLYGYQNRKNKKIKQAFTKDNDIRGSANSRHPHAKQQHFTMKEKFTERKYLPHPKPTVTRKNTPTLVYPNTVYKNALYVSRRLAHPLLTRDLSLFLGCLKLRNESPLYR